MTKGTNALNTLETYELHSPSPNGLTSPKTTPNRRENASNSFAKVPYTLSQQGALK